MAYNKINTLHDHTSTLTALHARIFQAALLGALAAYVTDATWQTCMVIANDAAGLPAIKPVAG